jgi:hypothetical protein
MAAPARYRNRRRRRFMGGSLFGFGRIVNANGE